MAHPGGNILIDSPRYAGELARWFAHAGGIAHILLSHQDDVVDAGKYDMQARLQALLVRMRKSQQSE